MTSESLGAPSRKRRIYIAGPYTKPDPISNVRRAIEYGNTLLDLGYAPFLPHLTAFWHLVTPRPYEQWLGFDLEWLHACDAVYRFSGESPGADAEVVAAENAGMPVFATITDLIAGVTTWVPETATERGGEDMLRPFGSRGQTKRVPPPTSPDVVGGDAQTVASDDPV